MTKKTTLKLNGCVWLACLIWLSDHQQILPIFLLAFQLTACLQWLSCPL